MSVVLLSETHRHPKIIKNGKRGIYSKIMHLAPAVSSGYEVCPGRSRGCTAACLNTAGFQYKRKYEARKKRTRLFFEDRPAFMEALRKEIEAALKAANRKDMTCGIRLNGTSDIRWEDIPDPVSGLSIVEMFPEVMFSDYTKLCDRTDLPDNYRLTFSRSEDNHARCLEALKAGMNVAVVFKNELPETAILGGSELRVIDGDVHDWRYGDYDDYPDQRIIVGLRAKGGKAVRDRSGFVVDLDAGRYVNHEQDTAGITEAASQAIPDRSESTGGKAAEDQYRLPQGSGARISGLAGAYV